jgi:L,D-transpeptidase catalytic domain
VISFQLIRLSLGAMVMLIAFRPPLEASESPPRVEIVISVHEQRLALIQNGSLVRKFPVSTSKFGLGDKFGSYKTPLGRLRVCRKLGDNLPQGAVFKHRSFGGEVVPVNAQGRDPIVTRILWLEGGEPSNRNARSRGIYIHGTPQERSLGKATSYGCVRMRSRDVVKIFDAVPIGTPVTIITKKLPRASRQPLTIIAQKPPRPSKPNSVADITKKMHSSKPEAFKLTAWSSKSRSQTGS